MQLSKGGSRVAEVYAVLALGLLGFTPIPKSYTAKAEKLHWQEASLEILTTCLHDVRQYKFHKPTGPGGLLLCMRLNYYHSRNCLEELISRLDRTQ